jgi:hypothetical protein
MSLLARFVGVPASNSLRAAEEWFFGSRLGRLPSIAECVPSSVERDCALLLSSIVADDELRILLPYVLERFDFAHRLNVKRDHGFGSRREHKRESGTFYTPSDVASCVVRHALGFVAGSGRAIDPACGTGIFLLTLLRELRSAGDPRRPIDIWNDSLFGVDVSHLAVESCAFVVTGECLHSGETRDPWSIWHAVRLNLWATDATQLDLAASHSSPTERARVRQELLGSEGLPKASDLAAGSTLLLWEVERKRSLWHTFPEATGGFDAIVMNPPYVKHRQGGPNLYLSFLETSLRIANPSRSFIGAVLPLSIAFSSDADSTRVRAALTRAGGTCRFAFFDREPHGLFGEEVKTRSTLLLRTLEASTERPAVETTGLMRLTSRTRASLLESLPLVQLGRCNVQDGVPKVGSCIEAEAYRELCAGLAQATDIRFAAVPFQSCLTDFRTNCVYVGPVAYNFINVSRFVGGLEQSGSPTKSNFLRWEARDPSTADAFFAVMASRISFWLWTVEGDGFHVSHRFVRRVANCWASVGLVARNELSTIGNKLWASMVKTPIVSRNGGSWSVAFSPLAHQALLTEADRIVAKALNIPPQFVEFLERASINRIVVDAAEIKRKRLVG